MQYTISAIEPVGPSEPGALSGFEARCSCGLVMRSSLLTIAQFDVRDHARYHETRVSPFVRRALARELPASDLSGLSKVGPVV